MSLFLILVKIDGVVYEIGYRNPEEYRIISLFHEVRDVIGKHGCNQDYSITEISAVLPWTENGEKEIIARDSDLYWVFEEFFVHNYPAIEFDVEFKKAEEQNNCEMYSSKLTPLLLKHFKRVYHRGRIRKENRVFMIKCSAYNDLGSIERSTRTSQGVVNDEEVFSSGSGQAGPSSSNINAGQAMGGLQEEPAGCKKNEEDSPWACF